METSMDVLKKYKPTSLYIFTVNDDFKDLLLVVESQNKTGHSNICIILISIIIKLLAYVGLFRIDSKTT